jgi:hypothetical protein
MNLDNNFITSKIIFIIIQKILIIIVNQNLELNKNKNQSKKIK